MNAVEFMLNFKANVKKNARDVMYELLMGMENMSFADLHENSRKFVDMFSGSDFVEDSQIFLKLCFIKVIAREQLSSRYAYCTNEISKMTKKIDVNELCTSIAERIVLTTPILNLKIFTENFKYLELLVPYSRLDMNIYLEHYSIALFNYLTSKLTKNLNIIEAIATITSVNLPEPISTKISHILKSLLKSLILSITDHPKTLYCLKYYSFYISKFGEDNSLKDQFDSLVASRFLQLLDNPCENLNQIPIENQDVAIRFDFEQKTARIVYSVKANHDALRKAVKDVVLIIDFFEMCNINRKIAVGVEESKEQVSICIEIHANMRFLIKDFHDIDICFPYEKAFALTKNIVRLVVKSQVMSLNCKYFPALLLLVDNSEVLILPNSFFAEKNIEKQQRVFHQVFDSKGEANNIIWLAQLILLVYKQRPELSEGQKQFNQLLNQMLRGEPGITWDYLSNLYK